MWNSLGQMPYFVFCRDNILVLDVFFEALNYETIEQKKAYEVAGLLGRFHSISHSHATLEMMCWFMGNGPHWLMAADLDKRTQKCLIGWSTNLHHQNVATVKCCDFNLTLLSVVRAPICGIGSCSSLKFGIIGWVQLSQVLRIWVGAGVGHLCRTLTSCCDMWKWWMRGRHSVCYFENTLECLIVPVIQPLTTGKLSSNVPMVIHCHFNPLTCRLLYLAHWFRTLVRQLTTIMLEMYFHVTLLPLLPPPTSLLCDRGLLQVILVVRWVCSLERASSPSSSCLTTLMRSVSSCCFHTFILMYQSKHLITPTHHSSAGSHSFSRCYKLK